MGDDLTARLLHASAERARATAHDVPGNYLTVVAKISHQDAELFAEAADDLTKAQARIVELEAGREYHIGEWRKLLEPNIQRFRLAAKLGMSAEWNPAGSRAMEQLLSEICDLLDTAASAIVESSAALSTARREGMMTALWEVNGVCDHFESRLKAARVEGNAALADAHNKHHAGAADALNAIRRAMNRAEAEKEGK